MTNNTDDKKKTLTNNFLYLIDFDYFNCFILELSNPTTFGNIQDPKKLLDNQNT